VSLAVALRCRTRRALSHPLAADGSVMHAFEHEDLSDLTSLRLALTLVGSDGGGGRADSWRRLTMQEYVLIGRARLGPSHVPTGRTQHRVGGTILPAPAELRIVTLPPDPGFLLLHLDAVGAEMTDTYHPTL
jgi:hypothetical protein